MSREELLVVRVWQIEGGPEDLVEAIRRQQEAQFRIKRTFDAKHRLRPQKIEEGDWVIVNDSSFDYQQSLIQKFAKRWFRPYEVQKVLDNGTYGLCELDGIVLRLPIAWKQVKIFKKWSDAKPYVTFNNLDTEEQSDTDHRDAESEESGLELIIDIGGETESATDDGE